MADYGYFYNSSTMPPRMNFDPHQHLNSGDVAVASNELKNV